MPLIGFLNLGLQVGQRSLHQLNIFFVITIPNFLPPVYMAHGVPVHRHADRAISANRMSV